MKKKSLLLFLAFFALSIGLVFAQGKRASGKVIDEKGEPLVGASVVVKGTTTGTSTNEAGRFSLSIPATAKELRLVVSLMGHKSREVDIKDGQTIVLDSDHNVLEEVVVTGYGSGQRVGSVVGAISTVKSDELENRPSANVVDGLQGKVAGVMIYTSSGEPSATSSVIIRGAGTLNGENSPLLILDGVAVESETIIAINPNDFESVTVLKDASATSIYGSRAANGVIVYTSKRGKRGVKGRISVNAQYGVSNMVDSKLWDNRFDTEGLLSFWEESGLYTSSQITKIRNTYGNNNTNWKDYFYKPNKGFYQVDMSYSGGSEKTDYFVSFGIYEREGAAYRSKYNRYSSKLNLNTTINDWMSAGVNMNLSYVEQAKNPYASNYLFGGLSYMYAPFYSPYDSTGAEYYDTVIPGLNAYSVKYRTDMFGYDNGKVQLSGSTYIQLTPIKGLKLKTLNSIDAYHQNITSTRSANYAGAVGDGYRNEYQYRKYQVQTTNTAEYRWNLADKHDFTALVGHEYIKYTYKEIEASVEGIADDRLSQLDDGTGTKTMSSLTNEYAYLSFLGRLNYGYDEKYFVDLSTRRDESSLLAVNNRAGWFFSIGGRWKSLHESFMKPLKSTFSKLDVRFSYGTQGRSDIDPYTFYSLVSSSLYGGENSWSISTFGNSNLGWEKQKEFSVGIEATAFKDRLNVTLEAYNKQNNDLQIEVPYPYTSGVTSVMKNAASMRNIGLEVSLSYEVLRGKGYSVEPYINLSFNKQKITELFPEASGDGTYWTQSTKNLIWIVGQPQLLYAPIWAGVNSETGAPQWYVPGDDPTQTVMDPNNVTSTFSTSLAQNLGKTLNPTVQGGFGVRATYKGIGLQMDFSFQANKHMLNNDRYFFENPTTFSSYNQSRAVLDYWKQAGDESAFPSTSYPFTQFDSRLVEDASFIRLKNISLSYVLPSSLLKKQKFLGSARIFLTGRNLLTWTKYQGQDPEVDSYLTYGQNPNTKEVSGGLTLNF